MKSRKSTESVGAEYSTIHEDIVTLLESARLTAARSINALMTASYWEIGRRIVEYEQGGQERALRGQQLLKRLSLDLIQRFGRGFSVDNLEQMRRFYLTYPPQKISETLSRITSVKSTSSALGPESFKITSDQLAQAFPLPWSAYVSLLSVKDPQARAFYETEALRCGWSVRQINRQIGSKFYERTLMSKNKRSMLKREGELDLTDCASPEEAIKDPYVLEFLDLKDEYSESDLEDEIINRLEDFLLELGSAFTFVGRQKRLRIDDTWFRVDLLLFHRQLRCLVIIDLKLDELTHADVGQMHMYCNYAREHWTLPDENPPVGLILCARARSALAHYALEGLPNKVLAAEYKTVLPNVALLQAELEKARLDVESRLAVVNHPKKKGTNNRARQKNRIQSEGKITACCDLTC